MELNKLIDHTLLKAEASDEDISQICEEAMENGFYAVCVNPYYVKQVKAELAGSDVKVCTVIGFPLGANCTEVKAFEAKKAVEDGADELDMVINIGALKSEDADYVEDDIRAVVEAADGKVVKVIIETALLTEEEKKFAISAAMSAGADFVKTSTGFSTAGATVEDVYMMSQIVGDKMGVKASGGIRTRAKAESMIAHGATRIGAGSSMKIIKS